MILIFACLSLLIQQIIQHYRRLLFNQQIRHQWHDAKIIRQDKWNAKNLILQDFDFTNFGTHIL